MQERENDEELFLQLATESESFKIHSSDIIRDYDSQQMEQQRVLYFMMNNSFAIFRLSFN